MLPPTPPSHTSPSNEVVKGGRAGQAGGQGRAGRQGKALAKSGGVKHMRGERQPRGWSAHLRILQSLLLRQRQLVALQHPALLRHNARLHVQRLLLRAGGHAGAGGAGRAGLSTEELFRSKHSMAR